jgi:hypothetical protein
MLSKCTPCQCPTPYNKISTGLTVFRDNVEHPNFELFKFPTDTTTAKTCEIRAPLTHYSPQNFM